MSSPFFRNVWRFNALAIAVCGIIGIFVGLFAAYHIAREVFRTPYQARDIARVDVAQPEAGKDSPAEKRQQESLQVMNFSSIAGTSVLWAPVSATQTYDYGSSSKEASSTRNYVFYDTASGASRKLLPGMTQLVIGALELRRPDVDGKQPPDALFFSLIEKDSNGDGLLTGADRISIALAKADGQGFTILENLNGRTIGEMVSGDGKSLVVMLDDGTAIRSAHIDLATFKVTRTDKVAP